jgi:hypothetical protein
LELQGGGGGGRKEKRKWRQSRKNGKKNKFGENEFS